MRSFLCSIVFFLNLLAMTAQQTDIIFHHIKEKDGLSNKFVTSFLKDSRGILWLGTQNGLDRFDGSHFYSFMRSRDTNSIVDNVINDLCEDKKGHIWGATNNGIFCYDPLTNHFKNYRTPSTRFARAIYNVSCNKNGMIWATGEWNIMKYDPAKDLFADILPLTASQDSLDLFAVKRNGMLEDPAGRGMWFATSRGLHLFNENTASYSDYKNHPADALFNKHNYSALAKSSSGVFFVFDNDTKEIISFNPATMKVAERISLPKEMKDAYGVMLFEDSDARLWFSTWKDGIVVIDRKKANRMERVQHDESNAISIAGDFMLDAMQDADGTIWCATTGGISRCNPSKNIFKLHEFGQFHAALQNVTINLVSENPWDKSWWIGFNNRTAAQYFPQSNQFELVDMNKAIAGTKGQLPGGIAQFRFKNDTVFFCTRNGTWFLSAKQHTLKPYLPAAALEGSFVIRDVVNYDDSIVYLSDYYSLAKWNSRSGKTVEIKPGRDTMDNGQHPVFSYTTKGPDGNLWFVAAFGWIGYVDRNEHISYIKMLPDPKLDYNGYYSSLAFDEKGVLWMANRGAGINNYDPATKKIGGYYQSDGLVTDDIHKAIPDLKGKIWSSSTNRFSVFEPATQSFYNFTIPVSESSPMYDNYACLTTGGNILTTINQHIAEFLPERTLYKPLKRSPEISMISINGKDSLLIGDIADKLVLEPDQKSLTLKFGMLTDQEIFPYFFEYQLTGIDDTIKIATASAEAVYNSLPPGKYIFKLVAVSKNSNWRSGETTLSILVRAPFYKTGWFLALIVALVIASVAMFYRFRIRQKERLIQLEGKAQLLEKEKALVMYENLKQHLNPHFLFNSLTSLSSLIRIDAKMAGNFLDKMSKVYRYILKNRDNEVVPLGEEIKFVQLYNDLQRTRFENALQINLNIDEEYYHRKIAPVTLQNLVENAIKHNTADIESPLIIELFIEDDYLVVRNNLQKKNFVETSNKQGLHNMESLYNYLSSRKMIIEESQHYFTVKIPLI